MNTYDPADYIVYVPMDRILTPSVSADPSDVGEIRLPAGYANESPRTRLQSCIAERPSTFHAHVPPPTDAGRTHPAGVVLFRSASGMA